MTDARRPRRLRRLGPAAPAVLRTPTADTGRRRATCAKSRTAAARPRRGGTSPAASTCANAPGMRLCPCPHSTCAATCSRHRRPCSPGMRPEQHGPPPPPLPPLYQDVILRPAVADGGGPGRTRRHQRRRPRLRTPAAAAAYLRPFLTNRPQEHILALLLSPTGWPLGLAWLGQGDPFSVTADLRTFARLLLTVCCRTNGARIVLAHNHPSGMLKFSRLDRQLTRHARLLTQALGVQFLDHLLFVPGGDWISFAYPHLFSARRYKRGSRNSADSSRKGTSS